MANKLDSPLPPEDWVIGMITHDLERLQEEEKPRMYGPTFLGNLIKDYKRDIHSGTLDSGEHETIRGHLEELEMLQTQFTAGLGVSLDEPLDDDQLLPWAVTEAKQHAIGFVGRQLIIDRLSKVNKEWGKYYSNDISYFVRRNTWAYLHSMDHVENDVGAIIHTVVVDYDVRGYEEGMIDECILKARSIFHELMLTWQD